ncbi:hypothetical protein [Flavobacterium sp. GT3P67]|uniref:hypothetical protein n=1 Tax=Flavobacterium sp. GT3P67 TaxID=2541722 RepID=UPI001049580B|nr:hypothetical protein [Flavobacterium sp. GT3P67]TDE53779.1 hypothetical protein E0H99_07115 [Flavobacterium sp. GT3P67]
MKAKIRHIVNQKHESSNGSCGTYFTDFLKELQIPLIEFEQIISEMYNNDEVQIREAINGLMVMKKV